MHTWLHYNIMNDVSSSFFNNLDENCVKDFPLDN